MSFADCLVSASTTPFDMTRSLDDIHGQALRYLPVGAESSVSTLAEQADNAIALAPAYRYLAFEAIGAVYDEVLAGDEFPPDRNVALAWSSTLGLLGMARYLSHIPLGYDSHRIEFPFVPQAPDEKLRELKGVAHRSERTARLIAAQADEVALVIENTYASTTSTPEPTLRGNYSLIGNQYVLNNSESGLELTTRPKIDDLVSKVRKKEQQKSDGRNLDRAFGCLALHVKLPDSGVSVFSTFWERFVNIAATDPRFFETDLKRIEDMHNAWDLTWAT